MVQARALRKRLILAGLAAFLVCIWDAGSDAIAQTETSKSWSNVRTVLDHRCVVCHSCYDAPCQLKLTSHEGLLRGGSKLVVYDTKRLSDAQPTRLGTDAQSVAEWRTLGFHSVAPGLLERHLDLGRQNGLAPDAPIPDELGLALNRPLVCPSPDEFDEFRDDHPQAGMPYATAPLSDENYALLKSWARAGTPPTTTPDVIPDDIMEQIAEWEKFLNAPDLRSQLMSRYLYEHLFLARLHFDGDSPRRFFHLVRSRTPSGEGIDVIASRRPFDDPGSAPFHYRLQLVTETIVHKEHLVYPLGPDRMARFRELFLLPQWTLAELPGYGEAEGGNPFSTFSSIPPRSRYEFLLDDALFFVRSFIRGPVCHGQTAVNVIEDRFWVSFLDPDADLSITDPSYLQDGGTFLELPVSNSDGGLLSQLQGLSHSNQEQYLRFRDARYQQSPAHRAGFDYDAIWDGDGTNPNALITVFRHFDNASAMTGFHGGIPETAWVIDYPIFERIYYNLVAGYDVFGRIEHQLSTRLYMDELRMESEDNFLIFMPQPVREQMHLSWYKGFLGEIRTYWHRRRVDDSFPSGIAYSTDAPKQEFLLSLLDRGAGLWTQTDPINRCGGTDCAPPTDDQDPAQTLRLLADQTGAWVQFLPDLSVLIVNKDDEEAHIFSLIHDKAHDNVAFMFHEAARRDPQSDKLTILPGLIGSYPNFYFAVEQNQMMRFVNAIKSVQTNADWLQVVAEFGVRRTSPDFWALSDQVHEFLTLQDAVQAGILDLNRYKDPRPGEDPT